MPAGGTATGSQVHIGTFADPGVPLASIGPASDHKGQQRVVSALTTQTTNIVAVGGGAFCGMVFSNGVSWKVMMA
jgi:hypothetical protein